MPPQRLVPMRQVPIKPSTTTPSGASLCSRLIEICLVCAVLAVLSAQRALAAPEPIEPTSPIRRIDRIHITGNERTQTQIIERELLFAVGDTLDEAVVAETERNLRRLLYLGDATISTVVQNDSTASIRIAVQDLYSHALSPLFAGQTSELSYGLVALDYNFLGRGQVAQVEVNHDPVSGNRITASHRFPRLTEARLALASDFTAAAEGHDLSLSLSRSYHSLSTRWSYGTRLSSHESISRLYAGRSLTARYSSSSEAATTWFGHSAGDQTKVRSSFSMTVQDRSFTPTHGFSYTPTDRRRVLPAVALTLGDRALSARVTCSSWADWRICK